MAKTVNITGEDVAAIRRAASVLGKADARHAHLALDGINLIPQGYVVACWNSLALYMEKVSFALETVTQLPVRGNVLQLGVSTLKAGNVEMEPYHSKVPDFFCVIPDYAAEASEKLLRLILFPNPLLEAATELCKLPPVSTYHLNGVPLRFTVRSGNITLEAWNEDCSRVESFPLLGESSAPEMDLWVNGEYFLRLLRTMPTTEAVTLLTHVGRNRAVMLYSGRPEAAKVVRLTMPIQERTMPEAQERTHPQMDKFCALVEAGVDAATLKRLADYFAQPCATVKGAVRSLKVDLTTAALGKIYALRTRMSSDDLDNVTTALAFGLESGTLDKQVKKFYK